MAVDRNTFYHGPAARLDRLEFYLVATHQEAQQSLLAGRVDGLSGLSADERDDLSRPVRLVVVDDVARAQRGDRLATLRACRRDYFRSAERPERDQ